MLEALGEDEARVWHWGTCRVEVQDIDATFEWGIDIQGYFNHVMKINSLRYFFNLKYDGNYIVPELFKMGYVHVENEKDLKPGTFTTLISDMNKWYNIKVKWRNGHVTEFQDAAKKFAAGMSVAGIAEVYKLDRKKGEIDYHKPRPVGYIPDAEEIEYMRGDVTIVAYGLRTIRETGMKKLTIGADALTEYKRLIGGEKRFRSRFPVLSDVMDAEIRRAYRGGFTYGDPRFLGQRQGEGLVLDVNSLYPHIMYSGLIPYGEPEYFKGDPVFTSTRPCLIFSVTFTAKLKPDHIPCIQIKGSSIFGATEYLRNIPEPTTLMVTNVDWALYNDQYDIDVISYNGGWRFRGAVGMFADYIDKWSEVKQNSTGGMRDIAKLYLNSLYGKLCSNPNVTGKVPTMGDDGIVHYHRGEDRRKAPIYTAAGVFITSLARELTIRAAQASYPVFAYADTDSLHLLTDKVPSGLDVHPTRMGAWKLEYEFAEAHYVRAKAYLELKKDGQYHVAWAGLPRSVTKDMTFDDLVEGRIMHGKLVPRAIRGGVVLKDTPYRLNLAA